MEEQDLEGEEEEVEQESIESEREIEQDIAAEN